MFCRIYSIIKYLMFVLTIHLGLSITTKAQITFEGFYGNESLDNRIVNAAITDEGDYILIGFAGIIGIDRKIWLLKISSSGVLSWSKYFGDSGDSYAKSINRTSEGNFLIGGVSNIVTGTYNHCFLKVDNFGNLIWNKFIGGIDHDEMFNMDMINSNTALGIGYTRSFGFGNADIYLLALMDNGTVLWKKVIGKIWNDWGFGLTRSGDGSILISGYTDISPNVDYNLFLMKCDSVGNPIWAKHYGASNYDRAYEVIETSDGGFLICGETLSFGNSRKILLLKVDEDGNSLWGKLYGGDAESRAYDIKKTSDGNVIVTGYTESFGLGNKDGYLLKITENGDLIWFKTYGSIYEDILSYVIETPDSGYLATGWSSGYNGQDQMGYVIKTDILGNTNCTQTNQPVEIYFVNLPTYNLSLGYYSDGTEFSALLEQTTPGLTSYLGCGIVPVELESFNHKLEGNNILLLWSTVTETNNYGFEIEKKADNIENSYWERIGFIEGHGTTTEIHRYEFSDNNLLAGRYQYRLKQLDYNGLFEYSEPIEVEVLYPTNFSLSQNYPNPFNPSTSIKYAVSSRQFVNLKVYDVLGNEVATLVNEEKPAGEYEVEFRIDNLELTSGIYFYRLTAGKFADTKKLILLK